VTFPVEVRRFVNASVTDWIARRSQAAQKMHTIPQELRSAFLFRGLKIEHMKTAAQRIQTADTIEPAPQILRLRKILVCRTEQEGTNNNESINNLPAFGSIADDAIRVGQPSG
jgi:hypothetical protein